MVEPIAATDEARADARPPRLDGALLRYRIIAYVVGVGLVVLVLIGVPLQIFAHRPIVATIVGIAHGYLFMVYLVLAFDMGRRARWSVLRIVAIMAAGTVPFLSFYAERRVTRWVHEQQRAHSDD